MTDWIQALVGAGALVLAAGAVMVSAYTYRDQQQINRDQLALNDAARQRSQQRFAGRVAWWSEESTDANDNAAGNIIIQNRSPVPIHWVWFAVYYPDSVEKKDEMDSAEAQMMVLGSSIPPCAIREYRVTKTISALSWKNEDESVTEAGDDVTALLSHGNGDLHFRDPEGDWLLTAFGLTRYTFGAETEMPIVGTLEEVKALREIATDCGEGD